MAKPYYGASAAPAPSESSGAAAPQIDHSKIIGSKIRKILELIEPIINGDHIPSQMHMIEIIKDLGKYLNDIKENISTLKENEILMKGAAKLRELGIEIKHFENLIGLEKVIESFLVKLEDFVKNKETCHDGIEIPTDIDHPILELQRRSLMEIELEVAKAINEAMNEIKGAAATFTEGVLEESIYSRVTAYSFWRTPADEAEVAGYINEEIDLITRVAQFGVVPKDDLVKFLFLRVIANLFAGIAEEEAMSIEIDLEYMPEVNLPIPAPHETTTVDDAMIEDMPEVNLPIPAPHEMPTLDDAMVEDMPEVNLPIPAPHETTTVDDAMIEEAMRIEQNLESMLGAYFVPMPALHETPTVDDVYRIDEEDILKFPIVTETALEILSGVI